MTELWNEVASRIEEDTLSFQLDDLLIVNINGWQVYTDVNTRSFWYPRDHTVYQTFEEAVKGALAFLDADNKKNGNT